MAEQSLSIFEEEVEDAVEVSEAEEVEATQEEQPEPEEAKATEEADTGEQEAAPPVAEPEDKQSHTVPITAILDEREKRQNAERRAQEVERQLEDLRNQQRRDAEKQRQQPPPDFYEDPDARMRHEAQQMQGYFTQQKLEQSRFLAEREYGAELVGEAFEYFNQHPQQSQQFLSHPSPFHAAVEFYKRQRVADEIGADPEAWRAKEREALKAEILAEMQTQQPQPSKPKPIPGSLAGTPSAGKSEPATIQGPAALQGFFSS